MLFPWSCAVEIDAIPPGEGVNALLQARQVIELPVDEPRIHGDLDTPADYAAALKRFDQTWRDESGR